MVVRKRVGQISVFQSKSYSASDESCQPAVIHLETSSNND